MQLKSIFYFFLLNAILGSFGVFAEIPEPYRSVVDLPFDDQGWFVNDKPLEAVLARYNPTTVIEIGSWLGCSTRFIASHLNDNGCLYAIDTWAGSQNEALHQRDKRLPNLYAIFLSNIRHAGLTNKIIPIRMDTMEAARNLNVIADLIYIDGDHATASVEKDILAWHKHLKDGGVMCGDDWLWDSVRKAVVNCAAILNKPVYSEGNFWSYSEIPPHN